MVLTLYIRRIAKPVNELLALLDQYIFFYPAEEDHITGMKELLLELEGTKMTFLSYGGVTAATDGEG